MDANEQRQRLESFVKYALTLHGDEKGEAQVFLDHLFRAFGHEGITEAGATLEWRVPKRPGISAPDPQLDLLQAPKPKAKSAGKKFADLLWPGRVLIEMKSRGEHLEKHYDQIFEYWSHIVPHRPPYVVLCNFDEFWIYDFNTQLFDPVDKLLLHELPERWSSFAFLLPYKREPVFDNNRVAVTRKAAALLSHVFQQIVQRGEDRPRAQRFILQLLVSLVSEKLGLLPGLVVSEAIRDALAGQSAYDLFGGLFRQMNSPEQARGGRWQGVDYFNGGLFATIDPIDVKHAELYALETAAREDWSKVKPEIFGTLFQSSMDSDERHAYGAHFTSEVDIQKVVGPTITRPWRERIENATTRAALKEILAQIRRFRVLDPACGSGNFLYVAYRELKRLERRLLVRLREKGEPPDQLASAVSLQQFYGLDVIPFAVELAKVTLMLAKELELLEAKKFADADGLQLPEKPLPLDNLDKQILCADALFTPWPKVDVIIGNPPFLGAKWLKPEHGPDYVNRIRALYPEVPGMADFCVYWIRKAHEMLPPCTAENPCSGRAGLVGTQNIRNNQSRVGGLDYVVRDGTITEAVDNQPWSGEANVHVSIANWEKTQDPALLPKKRRLWFKVEPSAAAKILRKAAGKNAAKDYDLSFREVAAINSALSDKADVGTAQALSCNEKPKRVFQGVTPGHDGFVLNAEEKTFIEADGVSGEVIHAYLTGRELVTGDGTPERFIIDFQRRTILDVQNYKRAFDRIQQLVLPDRERKAEEGKDADGNVRPHHRGFLERWWALSWDRKELFSGFTRLSGRFIACSRVTKRPIFMFLTTSIWPSDKVQAFLFDDDYSFGILQSAAHWQWFLEKCSKLKSDFSYSIESVFDTFPWPQTPSAAQVKAVAAAGREVRRIRDEALPNMKGGLRALYRTLELPGANPLKTAHAALDAAVREAYGMSAEADPLAFLLDLNLACAAREKAGEKITPPGLPAFVKNRDDFITTDCVTVTA